MEKKLILRAQPNAAAAMLTRAGEGDAALLYLYMTVHGDSCLLSQAAAELKFTEKQAQKAVNTLLMYGIVSEEGTMPPRDTKPTDPAELAALREGDADFRNLCGYLEGALGRILRRNDLEALCTVHYDLGLPCDVLMLMINYCRSRRRLNIREIERLSYDWNDNGINTYDRAVEHLTALKEKQSRVSVIMTILGFYGRRPSDSERAFIEKWISMGFDDEMIKLAYERMMARTHEVSFAYLNAILERWHKEGITTAKRAEADKTRKVQQPALDNSAIEAQVIAQFEKKRSDREIRQHRRLEALIKKSPDFEQLERQIRLLASQAARSTGEKRESLLAQRAVLTEERARVLKSFDLPADWLDNTPDCPKCRDRGFIGTEKCECLKKAVEDIKNSQKSLEQ